MGAQVCRICMEIIRFYSAARILQKVYKVMDAKNKSSILPDEFYTWWAQFELRIGKINFIIFVILLVVIIDRIFTQVWINRISDTMEYQAKYRIMYGIANSDGVFVSVDKRPENLVAHFAESAMNNLYVNDKTSLKINFEELIKKYDPRTVESVKPDLEARAKNIITKEISTMFIPSSIRLVDNNNSYQYIAEGYYYEYAERIEILKKKIRIKIVTAKVPPTTVRYAGLTVYTITEETIK